MQNDAREASPVDRGADADPDPDSHDIVEEVQELSLKVVSDSLDHEAVGNESARVEGDQEPSVGAWCNTNNSKGPASSQNSDFHSQHGKKQRNRVIRTRSVKAVIKDAKNIVGDSIDLSVSEQPNGDAENSTHMDNESREVSSLASKENTKKGRKRGRTHTSQTTACEQDDGVSEGRSDSVVAGGPRTRRRKVAANVQVPAEKRYNLRGSKK